MAIQRRVRYIGSNDAGTARRAVLGFLVRKGVVSEALRCKRLGWSRSGFSLHH